MFSMCSELTPRARIPDTRIPQLMQPCLPGSQWPGHRGTFSFDAVDRPSFTIYSKFDNESDVLSHLQRESMIEGKQGSLILEKAWTLWRLVEGFQISGMFQQKFELA